MCNCWWSSGWKTFYSKWAKKLLEKTSNIQYKDADVIPTPNWYFYPSDGPKWWIFYSWNIKNESKKDDAN